MGDSPEFYTNAINIASSLYDVTLEFRANSPIPMKENHPPVVESKEVCTIRMSPQHAKALAILLLKQVEDYEKQFSLTLPVEVNIQSIWNNWFKKD